MPGRKRELVQREQDQEVKERKKQRHHQELDEDAAAEGAGGFSDDQGAESSAKSPAADSAEETSVNGGGDENHNSILRDVDMDSCAEGNHLGDAEGGEDSGGEEEADQRHTSNEPDNKEQERRQRDKSKLLKTLSKKKVEAYNEALRKRGVLYLSRVPPFMKPQKVKHLLEPYGEITRIYLVEEDASSRRKRVKSGGNKNRRYTEGWIEFADKTAAKAIAASLNNTPLGGKKGDYYREDIWNLKFLRHFKWDHLTEKVAYERRVREQRLRLETVQAKRDSAAYLEMVEKGKAFRAMDERKAAVRGESGGGLGDGKAGVRRKFRQARPVKDVGGGAVDQSVLRAVFAPK